MKRSWSKADIHIHTTYSIDGTADVEEVLAYVARKTDLRVIAITDHDTIDGALEARRIAGKYGVEVVVGEEVSTSDGHLLALFIEEFVVPGRPAAETIAAVHAQGGLCIAAHPYAWVVPSMGWAGLRERQRSKVWHLDGVEGFNASLWMPTSNQNAVAAGKEFNLAVCGGSDSHQLSTIGLGYTRFLGFSAEDLRASIQARQTQPGGISWGWRRTVEYVGLKVSMVVTDITAPPSLPSQG